MRIIVIEDETTGAPTSLRATLTSRHDDGFSFRHFVDLELYKVLCGRYNLVGVPFEEFPAYLCNLLESCMRSAGESRTMVRFVMRSKRTRGKMHFIAPSRSESAGVVRKEHEKEGEEEEEGREEENLGQRYLLSASWHNSSLFI